MSSADQKHKITHKCKCGVLGCKSNYSDNPDLTFHRLPKANNGRYVHVHDKSGNIHKVEQLTAWAHALKIKIPIRKSYTVCSLHFTKEDYAFPDVQYSNKRKLLLKNAVPSVNVPGSLKIEKTRFWAKDDKTLRDSGLRTERINDFIVGAPEPALTFKTEHRQRISRTMRSKSNSCEKKPSTSFKIKPTATTECEDYSNLFEYQISAKNDSISSENSSEMVIQFPINQHRHSECQQLHVNTCYTRYYCDQSLDFRFCNLHKGPKFCNRLYITMDFIPTRAALNKRNADKSHQVTIYEAPKKKLNPNKIHHKKESVSKMHDDIFDEDESDGAQQSEQPVDERRKQELEMKKFRYDIIKFGMSGLEKQKARQAKVALAISLGAKPPKNKRKNYKRLLDQKKMEKVREKKKDKFVSGYDSSQITLTKHKNKKPRSKDAKDKSGGILGVYGKVTKDKNKGNTKDRNKKNFKKSRK